VAEAAFPEGTLAAADTPAVVGKEAAADIRVVVDKEAAAADSLRQEGVADIQEG
jgi:hypothetical protein